MELQDRLKVYLKSKNLTFKDFETICDLSNGTAARLRDTTRNSTFDRIAKKCDININWLKTGEGEMLNSNAENDSQTSANDADESSEDKIPLLPVEAIAGRAIGYATGVTLRDCRFIDNPIPGADVAIQVSGDSMLPEINPGTILYIKKILSKTFIPWGHPVVLDTIDGSLVKRIYPVEGTEEYIIAKSTNPDYPPYKVYTEDIIGIYRILGSTTINSTL